MSQELVSQINHIQRTCQGCDKVYDFKFDAAATHRGQPSAEDIKTLDAMTSWYTVVREVLDPESNQFVKITAQACSVTCVPRAAAKLAGVDLTPAADNIDLGALQQTPRPN